jgi:hypothetical protein
MKLSPRHRGDAVARDLTAPARGIPSSTPSWCLTPVLLALCAGFHALTAADVRPAAQVGMLDVTTVEGVDSTGQRDSTLGLNRAIRQARESSPARTLFLPSGTYLVSDTVLGVNDLTRGSTLRSGDGTVVSRTDRTIVLVGSTRGPRRPVIRLKDGAAGFGDPEHPRPVVEIRCEVDPGGREEPNMGFFNGFRGIDIDLGAGNPGSIGLKFDAAQSSFLEDVRIEARDGFAGFSALPGRNSTTGNIEVVGGRYGIQVDGTSLGATIVGARLRGQTGAAMVVLNQMRGLAITGFEIHAARGPAIILGGNGPEAGICPLIDGSIVLEQGGAVVENRNQRFLGALELYVRGADRFADGIPLTAPPGQWTRIIRLAQCPPSLGKDKERPAIAGWNLRDGERSRQLVLETEEVSAPPSGQVQRHVWSRTPGFEDADVFVPPDSELRGDITERLQAWLDAHESVYLPAGTHLVSRPLLLPSHHQLLGVPGFRTLLKPADSWRPREFAWVIASTDDRNSRALLMDLLLHTPHADYLGAVRWRAGRDSMVRQVTSNVMRSPIEGIVRHYQIDSGGGGRWYGLVDQRRVVQGGGRSGTHLWKLTIQGTSEPLFFYGLNLEHLDPPAAPYLTISDASNVFALGMKTEAQSAVVAIRNSSNVLIAAIDTFTHPDTHASLITVEQSRDLGVLGAYWRGGSVPLIRDDRGGEQVLREHFLGLYSRGSVRLPGTPGGPNATSAPRP